MFNALLLCFCLRTVLTEYDLQQQNAVQDQLNPLSYYENADITPKEQNKRTIFNMANYGWAKHVAIKPLGHKFVLGYSPVDLKYSSVIQPLSVKHSRYIYGKPNIHLPVKRPILQLRPSKSINALEWKLVTAIKPAHHHHHLGTRAHGVVYKDHVDVSPIRQVPHINNVHHVQSPHEDNIDNVPVHVDYIQPPTVQPIPADPNALIHPVSVHTPSVPVSLEQPVTHSVPVPQLVPSPLLEVFKPNLGVLPLGAALPTSILKGFPNDHGIYLKPVLGHHSTLIPHPHFVHQAQLYTQPMFASQPAASSHAPIPQPVLLPRPTVALQPTFPGSILPSSQVSVNAIHLGLPTHIDFQFPKIAKQLPPHPVPVQLHEQHEFQASVIPGHSHFISQPVTEMQYQQQLPLNTASHFQPVNQVGSNNVFHQQLPDNVQHAQFDQSNQHMIQQTVSGTTNQLSDQVSTQQFFQGSISPQQNNFEQLENQENGYVYQQPDLPFEQQVVQPGNTDLQLPLHLPQHHSFTQNSEQFQQNKEFSHLQNPFRPSIQLEPPYNK